MPIDPWRPRSRRPFPLIPLFLGILALLDLRVELELLADHFTLAGLVAAIRAHLLAVTVLLLQPSLIQRFRAQPPSPSD